MLTKLLVAKLNQFEPLAADDVAALEAVAGDVKLFDHGEDMIRQGDDPKNVHLVLDGWACRYKVLPSGERHIIAYLIPGDLCDVNVTLLDAMDHSIGALSACRVLYLPRENLIDLIGRNVRLFRALWWCTMVDEAILREWLVNIGGRRADQRVAHLICEMLLRCRAVGLTSDHSFEIPLTQQELGDTMGVSAIHMNRSLQALRADGLIATEGRRYEVPNFRKLMEFAEFDPLYLHQVRKAGKDLLDGF